MVLFGQGTGCDADWSVCWLWCCLVGVLVVMLVGRGTGCDAGMLAAIWSPNYQKIEKLIRSLDIPIISI